MKLSDIKEELKNSLMILKEYKAQKEGNPVVLNDKVDKFIKWYEENGSKEHSAKEMRDFIEKMAVWYELRYPDYGIDIPEFCQKNNPIVNNIIFKNTEFKINSLSYEDIKMLDWDKFFNTKVFINCLCLDCYYLKKPKYVDKVSINNIGEGYAYDSYFKLSKKGIIVDSNGLNRALLYMFDKDVIGMNIKDFVNYLNEMGTKIPLNSDVTEAIKKYDNWVKQKDEMLNCVMYKILARGKDSAGYQRAMLFAQEFKRDSNLLSLDLSLDELDKKIDDYLSWYTKNIVKGNYTTIGEYTKPIEMRNFIDKMAIWYELRYPDYEVLKTQDKLKVNDITLKDSSLKENNFKDAKWSDVLNKKAFESLLGKDASFLKDPEYPSKVFYDKYINFNLSKNGIIKTSQGIYKLLPNIKDEDIRGMNIKDLVKLLQDNGVNIPLDSEVLKAIKDYDKSVCEKEEMLNCVMYTIIERGENRSGGRRGLLFAQEFNRNIDIPMRYGIDTSDPYLRYFLNDYLKCGGSLDLTCYSNYFDRESKYQKVDTTTVQKELKYNDYTLEEKELHQRLVNALARQINHEELRKQEEELQKEEIENKRLERKLEKSKRSF